MSTQKAYARVKPNWDFWGLIDLRGKYVLEPIYKTIFDWKDGIARIERKSTDFDMDGDWQNLLNGEYGFIDFNGSLITDFSFGYANDFSDGLAGVSKNRKWGFINSKGELVIKHIFDNVQDFKDGLCQVELNNRWGVIDKVGNWVLKNEFEELSGFSYGLAIASKTTGLFKKNQKFVINKQGNTIVDLPKEWAWFKPVSEKLILIGTTSGYPGGRTYGFMNIDGEITSYPNFYTTSDSYFDTGEFKNGKLLVSTEKGEKGYITEEGKYVKVDKPINETINNNKISNDNFDEVLEFSEGLALARKGNLWGIIDESFNLLVDFKFQRRIVRSVDDKGMYLSEYFPKFSQGLIGVQEEKEDGLYSGYLNKSGNIAIELKYRVAEPFKGKQAAANNG